jgi:hypothetical protein
MIVRSFPVGVAATIPIAASGSGSNGWKQMFWKELLRLSKWA